MRSSPVYCHRYDLPSEASEHCHIATNNCLSIMLDAGADYTVDLDSHFDIFCPFMRSLSEDSIVYQTTGLCSYELTNYYQTSFKNILDHDNSSIDVNEPRCNSFRLEEPPLFSLARESGYETSDVFYVLEKAVLLLERKADVSRRGADGGTVLHAVLKCRCCFEWISKQNARRNKSLWSRKLSISTLKDMLLLFLSAGADVYVSNRFGQTASMVAAECGRLEEWEEALSACGYNAEKVMTHSHSDLKTCTGQHQASKLVFEEYCEQLKRRNHPPQGRAYDHLWENVDIGSYKEDEETEEYDRDKSFEKYREQVRRTNQNMDIHICEEDNESEVYQSNDNFDDDINITAAEGHDLAEFPSEQINPLLATMDYGDEMSECIRGTQLPGDGLDLDFWSPVVGQNEHFLPDQFTRSTGNIEEHQDNGGDASFLRYNDSFFDGCNLAGPLNVESGDLTVEKDACELDSGDFNASTDAMDFSDLNVYYDNFT